MSDITEAMPAVVMWRAGLLCIPWRSVGPGRAVEDTVPQEYQIHSLHLYPSLHSQAALSKAVRLSFVNTRCVNDALRIYLIRLLLHHLTLEKTELWN